MGMVSYQSQVSKTKTNPNGGNFLIDSGKIMGLNPLIMAILEHSYFLTVRENFAHVCSPIKTPHRSAL